MGFRGFRLPFSRRPASGEKALSSVDAGRGGWFRIFESYAGAWQRNVALDHETMLSHPADFACKTLIAGDVAKLRVKLVQRQESGVWREVENWNYRVLSRPNHYQTRIQFFECWMLSKLNRGNTYVLKRTAPAGGVEALYVLDPTRVRPLVADNGDVFYELQTDRISGLNATNVTVPARNIIHDRFNCLFHPLVGVSPLFAAGSSVAHGLAIQKHATKFFNNGARPGGILTAPGAISDETAARLKAHWEERFSGDNAGKVAVLGDALKYENMAANADDSQLIEQLKWSAEVVCSVYHVPMYKVGLGQVPAGGNIQSLNIEYYSQCLQRHLEDIELLLDEGLYLNGEMSGAKSLGTEFDVDGLLRMDTGALFDAMDKARSVLTLDERRRRVDAEPLPSGGATVYLQQQDHSVEAIAARDAQLIAASKSSPPAANDDMQVEAARAMDAIRKGLR